MSLYQHVPHPHRDTRREQGPVQVHAAEPGAGRVKRFNTRAAVIVTRAVGTMWCAYAFTLLALYGLPAGLRGGPAGFVQWASSQFIQLVLLPVIIVGSAVIAEVSDRLAKRQFADVEVILHAQDQVAAHLAAQDTQILAIVDQLNTGTDGGLRDVVNAITALTTRVDGIAASLPGGSGEPRAGDAR